MAAASIVLLLALLALVAWMVLRPHLRASRRFGFDSPGPYLRAAPVSDVVHDDVIMGVRRIAGGALALSAYDLNADRFGREAAARR